MHPDDMRLETVVVCRVIDHASGTRQALEPVDLPVVTGPERVLDQYVLAVLQEIGQSLHLGAVGNAHERGVVAGDRHLLEVAIIRLFVDGSTDAT